MSQSTISNLKIMKPFANWKNWLGVVQFFVFAFLFLILPSLRLFVGSFTDNAGQFRFQNILQLFTQTSIMDAYSLSMRISAITALGVGIFAVLLAYAVTVGERPKALGSLRIILSGVS